MSDRMRSMSLRQFRERAAEISEPIEIAIRDREGNFRVLGFYTPYQTLPVTVHGTGRVEEVELPPVEIEIPGPKVIKTAAEAVAATVALGSVRPFPKSAQTGRNKKVKS